MNHANRLSFSFAWQLLRETWSDFSKDAALRLSAALSYYSVFSLAPLILIAVAIAGAVFGEEAVRGQFDDQLKHYMGKPAAEAVQAMVKGASSPSESTWKAVIGFATLLIGASGVFGQLKDALNTVWEVKARPGAGVMGFLRNRFLSFGMVLVIGFLLLVSLLISTTLAGLSEFSHRLIPVPDAVWAAANLAVSLLVSTALFAAIFKLLPDVRVPWRTVLTGSVVTAVLFEIGKFALAFYLGRESTASPFGAAGSIVLVLVWVYYASAILLFGAELTQVYARLTRAPVKLDRFVEPVTAAGRAQEGMA